MSRTTFDKLCECLRPYREKRVIHLRHPVSVEQRVVVTIWRLATNIEYRTLSTLFGLGQSIVCKVVNETCIAITTHLVHKFIRIPHGECLEEEITGFETERGFPQVVGAIDGTHTAPSFT